MSEVYKAVTIGIITVILALIIKKYKPEFAVAVSIIGGIIIVLMIISPVSVAIDTITDMCSQMGIDHTYIQLVIKVIGIAYLVQFAAETAKDAGETSIASKIELAGKVCIFTLTVPIMMALLNVVVKLIP